MERLSVPDTSAARVLVVGDVMLDLYWFGEVSRISPEAPVPVVLVQKEDQRLGGAANVAWNCKEMGARTAACRGRAGRAGQQARPAPEKGRRGREPAPRPQARHDPEAARHRPQA